MTSGVIDSHTNSVSTQRTFEEENNSKMADRSNYSKMTAQTRPHYFRRCKRLKTTKIEFLPDELILEILVRVPAEDIYNATRLVCRKWYKMIHTHNFINAHLQQQTDGLLVQCWGDLTLVAMGKDDLIEMSKLNYKFEREVKSSCNGLVLETSRDDLYTLYITNPATKQHFTLPSFLTNIVPYGYAIAYASASMEYKVFRALLTSADCSEARKSLSDYFVPQDDCIAVLTVGVDKDWTRRVRTQHLSPEAIDPLFSITQIQLITEGFLHWVHTGYFEYVVTLNIETEIITQFPVPPLPRHDVDSELMYHYLPMGSYLSLLVDGSRFSWEAWEMKPETGEWTKMPNIDLEPQFGRTLDCMLTPLGWLKFREVLIINVRRGTSRFDSLASPYCIAYNVHTYEYELFELPPPSYDRFLVHRSSLVWMDGC